MLARLQNRLNSGLGSVGLVAQLLGAGLALGWGGSVLWGAFDGSALQSLVVGLLRHGAAAFFHPF